MSDTWVAIESHGHKWVKYEDAMIKISQLSQQNAKLKRLARGAVIILTDIEQECGPDGCDAKSWQEDAHKFLSDNKKQIEGLSPDQSE